MKKTLSFLIVTAFLFLASCGGVTPSTAITSDFIEEAETEETSYDQLLESLPDHNYGGKSFRIATDTTSLIFSKNSAGITGKELYLRNRAIEEKYNIKITLTDESGLPTIPERITSEALAGTDYCDLVILE